MSTTFVLRVWTRFHESPDRVWAQKTAPEAFSRALPFWVAFRLDDPAGLQHALGAGSPFESTGHLGPVDWPVAVTEVEPGVSFVSRSSNALFHLWRHELRVETTSDGARFLDTITFAPAVRGAKALAVATERLFVRRHRADAEHLQADTRTIGVSALRVANDEDPR